MSRFKKSHGFTLLELMIVVVIVAISAAIALPSFNDAIVRNRMAGQANDLIGSINLARTVSIQLNAGGGICAANSDQTACGGSWDNGWIVWSDTNRNGAVNADEIRSVGQVNAKDLMVGATDIRFDGRGRRISPPVTAGNTVLDLSPRDCTSGKPFTRAVSISVVGSASVSKGDC